MTSLKTTIINILNCFETGTKETDYSSIFLYRDGPNKTKQVTLGRGYVESGSLWTVIYEYKKLGGKSAEQLLNFKPFSGKQLLPTNKEFLTLLVNCGKNDELFRIAQDNVFDIQYWNKGLKFFNDNGFELNLSLAVIQDSILHSGSILSFLRNKFSTKTPKNGGDEKEWIINYLAARRNWLATTKVNPYLKNTVYRIDFFNGEIKKGNWKLACPLKANDVVVC